MKIAFWSAFLGSALLLVLSARGDLAPNVQVPRIAGEWSTIAHSPDLGLLSGERQQPVDFAIWQAADGTWQLWSCIRGTKEPGKTRLFHRWESSSLVAQDWKPMGIAMQADPAVGETAGGLQAPHVIKDGDTFRVFYGDWVRICTAESKDGKTFTRIRGADQQPALFKEADDANARDPMVLKVGNQWHCYYTAHPNKKGSVYARTSADLLKWSDAKIVANGGQAGDKSFSAECPHVVELSPGHFYLFRTQRYGKDAQTSVYHSTDPLDFGLADKNGDAMHLVGTLPVAAPELIQHNGEWFIAALRPDLKGIQLAKLVWEDVPAIAAQHDGKGPVRVALFDDYGSFGKGVPRCTELLSKADGVALSVVKPALIREGGLKDFDVVIFTGGSGSKQANTLGLLGREQVRRFVQAGGGYIGICAGNYLACEGFSWGLGVLDAKTKSSKWARGVGDVKIEFTEQGQKVLGMPAGVTSIRYANGPVFNSAGSDAISDFQPLAYFRSEFAENGSPVGVMVDSPAMVAGDYGKGRVLCSSPHPEQQTGMEGFIVNAVKWVAGR